MTTDILHTYRNRGIVGRALGYWPLKKTKKRRKEKRFKIRNWVNSYQGLVIDI